jgi:eukaryotic-like serine/threonine-protein kinase
MHRTTRLTMAAACLTALAACAQTQPQTEWVADTPASAAPSAKPSPSASPTKKGPKLVDADLSGLKNYDLDLGVPVTITTGLDGGPARFLGSQPDGSVDFTGTAATESTRMTLRPAKVRKRTEDNKNHVLIVASPAVDTSGPESCVTDVREGVLRMEPCEPGAAEQAWRLQPAGDSGLFELFGDHTALRVDEGKIVKEGGWSAFETSELKP